MMHAASREEELLLAVLKDVKELKRQRDEALALLAIAQYDSDAQLNSGWLERLTALRKAVVS